MRLPRGPGSRPPQPGAPLLDLGAHGSVRLRSAFARRLPHRFAARPAELAACGHCRVRIGLAADRPEHRAASGGAIGGAGQPGKGGTAREDLFPSGLHARRDHDVRRAVARPQQRDPVPLPPAVLPLRREDRAWPQGRLPLAQSAVRPSAHSADAGCRRTHPSHSRDDPRALRVARKIRCSRSTPWIARGSTSCS